jgi:pyruvate,orthophosphate dikinase
LTGKLPAYENICGPMTRYVYDFDEPSEGGRDLLGGKGIGLAEMTQLGVPVPAGFTITTDASRAFMASGGEVEGLDEEIAEHIARLEQQTGKRFGDPEDPLLVSIRSGAAISMPGMMDSILNVGLNDESVEGLARSTGNEEFARDCYRRLIQMFGETVDDIPHESFSVDDSVERAREIYERDTGQGFPQDAREQLRRAITAVFDSWNSSRAQVYRRMYRIPDDLGTAVNVVQMVFGNKGDSSGTGVAFTRDPGTGEPGIFGEFLSNAQGEDVVAGTRTPQPLAELREHMPEAYDQLLETMAALERHYRDMQDIEFTIEQGHLYVLQTLTAKRSDGAAIWCAVDMTAEGLIEREEAVARIDPTQLDQLLHPRLDPDAKFEVAAQGLNASPGAAAGKIVLDADSAAERGKAGESVILVRWESTPDDIHGLIQA